MIRSLQCFDEIFKKEFSRYKIKQETYKPVTSIPVDIFKQSLKNYSQNNYVKFLFDSFGSEVANQLISKYYIGTSKHWPGATVFWQIDITGRIRTGKVMLYDPGTGKRIKKPFVNLIHWVHKALKLPDYELKQCFFGEHFLRNNTKPVAIVESEKTAIIASAYLPQFTWLAAGSKDGLNPEKCRVLHGRNVILFPDLNGFELWSKKAKELSNITRFTVSGLLERKATESERKQGLDLADFLVKFPVKAFQSNSIHIKSNEIEAVSGLSVTISGDLIINEFGYPAIWDEHFH